MFLRDILKVTMEHSEMRTENSESNGHKVVIYALIGAAAFLILGYLIYSLSVSSQQAKEQAAAQQLQDVTAALDQTAVQTSAAPPSANPIKQLSPAENPIEKTNPFNHTYENPFQ